MFVLQRLDMMENAVIGFYDRSHSENKQMDRTIRLCLFGKSCVLKFETIDIAKQLAETFLPWGKRKSIRCISFRCPRPL